ncbi:MAG: hypothetical protein KDN22_07625 [Verrucomicrobiae bacterium]|nr:hypothetical protein [Verrucomicrobiae bacterium]
MNKPIVISAWLVSCAAAFGLGNYFKIGKADQGSDAAAGGGTGAFVSVDPSSTGGGGGPQVRGTKKATAENPFAAYVRGGVISPEDMKTLMKDVMDENDPLKRSELFNKLLANLTPENAKEAYAQLRDSRGRGDMEKSQLFLNAWGRIDGAGAMTELMARRTAEGDNGGRGGRGGRGGGPGGRGGDAFEMMSILSGWATTDAGEATKYLNSNETIDDREKGMLQNGIVQGLLVNGVGEAMQYVSDLPTGDNSREWMMRSIADEVMEGGLDSATSWVNSISDSQLKQGALNSVVGQYMREDIDAAAKWVATMAGESYASDAVRQVAEQMAQTDPQKALDWADALAAEAQPQVYREALNEWAKTDVTAASEYLLSMNKSPERDQAITGLTSSLQREDPASAIVWAQDISDPQLQQETLTSVARSWYYSDDKEAASAWLETSGLPAEAVEKVIAEPNRGDFRGGGGFGGGGRRRGGG